jgi:hypothetical protein
MTHSIRKGFMADTWVDRQEAELIVRLEDQITGRKKLTEAEADALRFDTMLFLIRTRGL